MLNYIYIILTILVQYFAMYFVMRFVFLENGVDDKTATYYYPITAVISVLMGLMGGETAGTMTAIMFGMISIFVGRKKHRFRGALLIFPVSGLLDGLFVPFLIFPSTVIQMSETDRLSYNVKVYAVIILLFAICYIFFRKKIMNLIRDTEHRSLKLWERVLLCIIGVLLLFYSSYIETQILGSTIWNVTSEQLDPKMTAWMEGIFDQASLFLMSVYSLILTITVIIVVMVGNRQNFFYKRISKMQFNIIIMMAEIVENRDKNTGGHIKRTAKYVEIISKQLKRNGDFQGILTDEYIKDMCVAAPLHDIGKIHVSDVILNKPGKLTDEEFAIMKSHAAEGRALLTSAKKYLGEFNYLDIAIQMAGSHHEWYDGSSKGYPDNIKGDEIPVCARIMAVADVFDALTTKRIYKDAMPIETAYRIIREESGTHFDPVVVDAFFKASVHVEQALKEFYNTHYEEESAVEAGQNAVG